MGDDYTLAWSAGTRGVATRRPQRAPRPRDAKKKTFAHVDDTESGAKRWQKKESREKWHGGLWSRDAPTRRQTHGFECPTVRPRENKRRVRENVGMKDGARGVGGRFVRPAFPCHFLPL